MSSLLRKILLVSWILAAWTGAFIPPSTRAQADPSTLPARESHEGLLIAADPYDEAARSKQRFGKKHPQAAGLLALEVIFRNDTDSAIFLGVNRIRLVLEPPGGSRQRIAPLEIGEVADRLLGKQPNPTMSRKPLPFPRAPKTDKDWAELDVLVRSLALDFEILPPQSTMRGFLFFDLNRRFEWLAHARLYVPDLKVVQTGQGLMFFEVDLAPALKR